MKKLFGRTARRFIAVASAFTCLIAVAPSVGAAQLKEARVTQVVNDVKLLLQQAAPRPAVVSDLVRHGTAVRTGTQSRSELTFADLTITRLGANTIFTFDEGTRQMNLIDGAILFQVPKGTGGLTIKTVAVTAGITGTTGIGEFHPATSRNALPFSKWLCLEGTFRLILPNGQSVEVGPGKMVTTDGKSFSKVLNFDIGKLVNKSLFFTGFDKPLASLDLIVLEEQKQLDLQLASGFVDTTTQNPLDLTRVVDVISQATTAIATSTSMPTTPTPTPIPTPTPTPIPTPSKFGTPSVISSPVPYVITSGTTITTDPTITTNGVTDFGKIYRGPSIDGPFSAWAFGSTLPFDTASGFDAQIDESGAGFKFTSLELTGDPTVSTTNGEINLGLIAVNGITSGGPGGVLTFAGISTLLLATQDGPINLGSEISFSGLHGIIFYARGAGGDLTLASPILGTTNLSLYAGGNITFNAGTDLTLGGDLSIQAGGGNISVSESGNITIGGSLSATTTVESGVTLGTGANITLTIGGDLTTGTSLEAIIDNSNGGTINNGGNITLMVDGSVSTQGLSLLVTNYADVFGFPSSTVGHIGTGGNIFVTTGGNLATDFIGAFIDNRNGASIDSGATISFNIAGALTTLHDASSGFSEGESLELLISNRFDTIQGGVIGSDATISLTAASVSIGGILDAFISNRPGSIGGSAIINFGISGDLAVQEDALFTISNEDLFNTGAGGTINSNATISLNAANISTGDFLEFFINNRGSPTLGTPGGMIGGDAAISVNSGNIFTSAAGEFSLVIGNQKGTIGSDATIDVTAANITANSLLAEIDNSNGGTISGDATINMSVSGSATVASDATVEILGSDGAAAAAINFNGGSYDAGGTFLAFTDGDGTITFNNASAHADVLKVGALGTNGVLNIGGGSLSADTTLELYASGSNGQLKFLSNVTLGGNGAKILAANSVTIFDNVVVTIGGSKPADVYTGFTGEIPNANYTGFGGNGSTTGTFAGAGANDPQPLSSAPPFGPSSPAPTKSRVGINVSDSGQLLALLDGAVPGPGGKITIPGSKIASNWRDSSGISAAGRLNAGRRAADMRDAHSLPGRRLP